jgi:hypothetical protein
MMELPNMMHFKHRSEHIAMLDLVKIEEDEERELIKTDYKSPPQINDELITMSTLVKAKWKNVLSLDIIKTRNKPKKTTTKPNQAPFFLQTVAGFHIQFDVNEKVGQMASTQSS